MKNNSIKENFIRLRAEGNSLNAISKELNTSKPTLIKWEKEFEKEIKKAEHLVISDKTFGNIPIPGQL